MAGFRFKYQNILKYRQDSERNAKNNLAMAVQALENAKLELKALKNARFSYLKDMEKALSDGVSAASFRNYNISSNYYEVAVAEKEEEIALAEKAVRKARALLQAATQEKKKMEKIKEKELALFREEELRAENVLVDSLITYKESNKISE